MADIELAGYRPGSLAGTIALHMDYYAAEWGFGAEFETKLAREMGEFVARMDSEDDLFLTAWRDGDLVGSITLDATGGGEMGAHLRWFIVGIAARGTGLGGRLMDETMRFADRRGHHRMWLTTFAGLDPARRLYEKHGFELASESDVDQWSGGVREQLFVRDRSAEAGSAH
ncbi:GNAT family N-acetyltransferase [Oricola sp.]|uniref:GNAT family N-acetyltransferase n=1 Tax=Oricola sp. TaxID=1979950 RepID=UPI003BA8B452